MGNAIDMGKQPAMSPIMVISVQDLELISTYEMNGERKSCEAFWMLKGFASRGRPLLQPGLFPAMFNSHNYNSPECPVGATHLTHTISSSHKALLLALFSQGEI